MQVPLIIGQFLEMIDANTGIGMNHLRPRLFLYN